MKKTYHHPIVVVMDIDDFLTSMQVTNFAKEIGVIPCFRKAGPFQLHCGKSKGISGLTQ